MLYVISLECVVFLAAKKRIFGALSKPCLWSGCRPLNLAKTKAHLSQSCNQLLCSFNLWALRLLCWLWLNELFRFWWFCLDLSFGFIFSIKSSPIHESFCFALKNQCAGVASPGSFNYMLYVLCSFDDL